MIMNQVLYVILGDNYRYLLYEYCELLVSTTVLQCTTTTRRKRIMLGFSFNQYEL